METYLNPSVERWDDLCERPASANPAVEKIVKGILKRVKRQGDDALRELSLEIDKRELGDIQVSQAEIEDAVEAVSPEVTQAIADAAGNIEKFHKAQLPREIRVTTAPGVRCIQRPVAIQKVGLYIPGGTAPLFSTVLMLAIPARIAGCKEVILCTPTGRSGKVSAEVLYAASFYGIEKIYKVGGAQAIASMAYGTQTIPKVDKIFGPGNQFVTTAKQMLGGREVAIDMPAGPSEVMVIADSSAKPAFIAADLLSQAEHGRDSQVMLVCDSLEIVGKVQKQLEKQTAVLDRAEFALSALSNSLAVVFDDLQDIIEFANEYAPEHLIISTRQPWEIADQITSAGSVFVGHYTPESAGDYASGTNHTLPTCGWGRSFSGVNIDSFMRKMTIQEISRKGLAGLGGTIVTMAEAEGLQAHANAVKVRVK
ncbi:MAG: histidinol dehydrogenase [Bacteroidales bacterium]|nr:histidinol dehydrogenase [Bacteroidales bacterium]